MDNQPNLRDFFAMAALQEFLRDDLSREIGKQMGRSWCADQAYRVADEMLVSRQKDLTKY